VGLVTNHPILWLRLPKEEEEVFPPFMRFFRSQCDEFEIWDTGRSTDAPHFTVIRGDYQFEGIPVEGFPRFHVPKHGPSPPTHDIVVVLAITRIAVNTAATGYSDEPFDVNSLVTPPA